MNDSICVRFGPSVRAYLPALVALVIALSACEERAAPAHFAAGAFISPADTTLLEDRALTWGAPLQVPSIRGLRMLYDTPVPARSTLAVVRSVVRSNHRLDPFDALTLASAAAQISRAHRLDAGFFSATLLQESAFEPDAFSSAGAVGIAQFTLETAADYGIDPFDWRDALEGSAALLGRYVARYDGLYRDPYAVALAAYNAGPGTVAFYRGVPPYPETRAYIAAIYDRWARILHDTGSRRRLR